MKCSIGAFQTLVGLFREYILVELAAHAIFGHNPKTRRIGREHTLMSAIALKTCGRL